MKRIRHLDVPTTSSNSASHLGISAASLLLVGVALAASVVIRKLLLRTRELHSQQTEQRRDKILQDSFPASDAPGSQYFDIPVNRR